MPRYQLKDKCLFVDAQDLAAGTRYPEVIPFAHILDKSTTATYLKLNDTAGFIARFIVIGVDTDLIPQIILSEYGGTLPRLFECQYAKVVSGAKNAVKAVVEMLKPYLTTRTPRDSNRHYRASQRPWRLKDMRADIR